MKDRYIFPAFFCYYEDGTVGVVFPDLPGCVSQGDGDEDALRMAREAMITWRNTAGSPPARNRSSIRYSPAGSRLTSSCRCEPCI